MRFMIIRKADKETESGVLPNQELFAAMMKYNEELVKAGVMLDGQGLQPSAKGARVKFSGGKPTVLNSLCWMTGSWIRMDPEAISRPLQTRSYRSPLTGPGSVSKVSRKKLVGRLVPSFCVKSK